MIRRRGSRMVGALLLAGCVAAPPIEHIGPVTAIAIAHDGCYSCSQAGVATPASFLTTSFRPFDCATARDVLIVGGGQPGVRGTVAVFHGSGQPLRLVTLGDDVVYAVAMHPDGFVLAGSADGSVRKLTLPTLDAEDSLASHSSACRAIAVDPVGSIATAGLDGIINLYDGETLQHLQFADHTAGVECLLFTPEGLVSGARDGRIRLHRNGRLVRSYPRLDQPVVALCEHDGRIIAGLRNGRLVAVDRKRARTNDLTRCDAIFALASTDGELLVGSYNGVVRVQL